MRKKVKQQRELKGPSLTLKWAFASSFFIFVVFTIFAVITYKSTVNLIVAREKSNAQQMMRDTELRLAVAEEAFDAGNIVNYLIADPIKANDYGDNENLYEIDPLIAELGQRLSSLYVYDVYGQTIFKTEDQNLALSSREETAAEITTINDEAGFLMSKPLYSSKTKELLGYGQVFYKLNNFYEIRNRLLSTLIILEIVSLVLSSGLGFILSSYFLKPLKVLRDTMEVIRKNPQSTVHVPKISSNDELADLAEIFNEMLDRMRLYIESQEHFVEDVSHELRTPVAVIEGHLNMLNRWGKDDPEILDESILASLQEISRMKSLVQEMLDLSRAEQSEIMYKNEISNGKEVIYQVFNNFKILYPEFVFTIDDDLPKEEQVQIYRNHFEQLIIIILDNAVKYSTKRKEVHISISKSHNQFEIAIQDFGEGIAEEEVQKVFNRFYRVDKARARNKGGNGLGLSIAKQLVENYKGRISVESSLGQGTIFRIFIPIVAE
ncbi:signal transduction histidine kinase [Enterococcus sp. PF1-24]|uniref:HAMP domain-containing sensor histidine kinase n=1 Tax=unclassified Enterococcus TaxID=2608891 RepID=UPI002476171F|nr:MULTISPECIES: HAMP domain-containing histidine kinase [unclassified Enterococcus]MDH6365265.1 signal transduction histidine kinase [Enterococcus sp. PFB1-1]MDH6402366.1 signal transduction histidine kinase [Enterococcus sp. PF1-24]